MKKEILLPDIGNYSNVEIIELLVEKDQVIEKDDILLTLETDKATMDVPSPFAGKILSVAVKVGDKISEGDLVCMIEAEENSDEEKESVNPEKTSVPEKQAHQTASKQQSNQQFSGHAGPAVRRLARALNMNLSTLQGSGRGGRITLLDLEKVIREKGVGGGLGFDLPEPPSLDFSAFGEVESQSLSRIKKISGGFLHRNWISIPHVTQFDEADITDLESYRQSQKEKAQSQGLKLTPLVFIMKAVVDCLQEYPMFNASLDNDKKALILKKYFHLGIAVNTEGGLVVPVVREVDKKDVFTLAKELGEISQKARAGQLDAKAMQGGTFTISSLGGIGGTQFTPIINAPEVAILGVSKSAMKPVYKDGQFEPRLILPLALSYDHRVIDGAQAAQFTTTLNKRLAEIGR